MAIQPFLAMTRAEMHFFPDISFPVAWMACHFSPYSTDLSNLPANLPNDSLLILNDRTPIHGHDPQTIVRQLQQCMEVFQCRGLLLDFQQPKNEETKKLISHLADALSFPVGVPPNYAAGMECAVFLPPVPPSTPLQDYLAPWNGREIWLELALNGEIITMTEQGAAAAPLPYPDLLSPGFQEENLHCHYKSRLTDTTAEFTLWRTQEDLCALIADAEELGITTCIGLYQELKNKRLQRL